MNTPEATCTGCAKAVKARPTKDGESVKTPMGWRRISDSLLCGECVKARSPSFDYRLHIAALMARTGAWQALMKQNAERAKRRKEVA